MKEEKKRRREEGRKEGGREEGGKGGREGWCRGSIILDADLHIRISRH